MPVKRSSSNEGAFKVSRKPRIVVGSSKWSGDGVKSPRSKYSDVGRGHKKERVATEGSEGSSGGVRTLEAKKKGSRGVQSRGNSNDAVSYVDANGKLRDTHERRKMDFKMKSESEGIEAVIDGKSDLKRKRISVGPGIVEYGRFGGDDKKSRSQSRRNVPNSCLDGGKKLPRKKDFELKDSSRNTFVTESGKFRGSESLDKKVWKGKIEGAGKLKHFPDNALGNRISNISDRRKVSLATQKETNQRTNVVGSIEKPRYRKDQRKKNFGTDSGLTEEPPKKKKNELSV